MTTLETSVTVVLVGVLSAIAIPSFLGWYQAKQLDGDLNQIQSALNETQQTAVTRGTDCFLTIPMGPEPTITGTCLTSERRLRIVTLTHNRSTPWTITFNFKGHNPDVDSRGTLVLSVPGKPNRAKCLAIARGIGLFRAGRYTGDIQTPNANSCMTS